MEKGEFIDATINIGFLKIAWTYCFVYLKLINENKVKVDYKNIISDVI